jgi:hypothetical protein
MTELEVLKVMAEADKSTPTLAYDATIPGYCVAGVGRVSAEVFESLYNKDLIIGAEVIHGGSVQLYDLTKGGVEYYEKNL